MKKHLRIYQQYFEIAEDEPVLCENCGCQSADIHHIKYKSRQGEDHIDNLMAMCRKCHDRAHNKRPGYLSEEYLLKKHLEYKNNYDQYRN